MDRPWVVEYFSESGMKWNLLAPVWSRGFTKQEALDEAPKDVGEFPTRARIRNVETGEIVEVKP